MDISRRLYSAAQTRELDHRAVIGGIGSYELMQRAAQACWSEVERRWPHARRIGVLCGSGNNGGDGYEIARLAKAAGRQVHLWQVGDPARKGDAVIARRAWTADGGETTPWVKTSLAGADVLIDALLGIGVGREVEADTRSAVEAMNDSGEKILSVDVPSGLDADTGRIWGVAVRADVTVSILGRKPGLHTGGGPDHSGEVVMALLDLPPDIYDGVEPAAHLLRDTDLSGWLPRRARNSHKGTHGYVLVVGGDHGMMGAALLAARAALRAGAGLVSVATRPEHAAAMTAAQPELMCRGVADGKQLAPLLREASAVVVGPGLGQEAWGRGLLARTLDQSLPMVIDADALNLLALDPSRRDNWVLTPHPGEAARLLGGVRSADIQDDRFSAVRGLQQKFGGVTVLKGAGTLVQGSELMLCPYGNPGMAGGGMGDVLSGIIGALLAQGLRLETAANAGVLAHALAGDRAAYGGERGMLAEDLIAELRVVVNA